MLHLLVRKLVYINVGMNVLSFGHAMFKYEIGRYQNNNKNNRLQNTRT